jgi:ribulose-phosphate 3-epimerase
MGHGVGRFDLKKNTHHHTLHPTPYTLLPMKLEIIPAIFCKTSACAKRRIALVESVADTVQIDAMDGKLVPNKSWFNAEAVATWSFDVDYELHLMVEDPLPVIHAWKRVPRFIRAIVHAETPKKLGHLIKAVKALNIEIGIAISPDTPLKKVLPHIPDVDMILVMGGKPGKSGQTLTMKAVDTVREIRKHFPKLPIGFDIGVSEKTISMLKKAGVTRFCSTNAIFKKPSPIRAIQTMKEIL